MEFVLLTCWDEKKLPKMLQGRGLKVETLPFIESTPKNILSQLFVVPRLCKVLNADIEFNPNPIGCFIGDTPLVNVAHDLYFDVSPTSYKLHHRLWWKLFFPASLRRARRTICVSENTRKDLTRFYPKSAHKSVVVHEAACLSGPVNFSRRSNYGLLVANVTPNKGVDTFIESIGRLEKRGRTCLVRHIGRDPDDQIVQHAVRIGIRQTPQSQGGVSESELCELYAKARYLAFPSAYEGFGLPILEAQKFGVPVIASDIPVLREVAGEGAIFFELGNSEQLADAIELVSDDEEVFSSLSVLATANERRFSWSKAARETKEVFYAALGN